MCYCWEKITGLSDDGYADPDISQNVFLGYNWSSPNFNQGTGHYSYDYGDFVTYFYMYLLQYGKTVNQALDSASWDTCGEWYFSGTDLYKGLMGLENTITALKLFGNGNNELPT